MSTFVYDTLVTVYEKFVNASESYIIEYIVSVNEKTEPYLLIMSRQSLVRRREMDV
jgi:hypothetical protein